MSPGATCVQTGLRVGVRGPDRKGAAMFNTNLETMLKGTHILLLGEVSYFR